MAIGGRARRSPPRTGPRILVVARAWHDRVALRRALELRGYRVADTAEGVDGLRTLRGGPFDAVLLDVGDGGATLRAIRAGWPALPVVLLGGGPAEGPGPAVALPKPVDRETLLDALARLLP